MKTVTLIETDNHLEALSIKEELESRGIVCLIPNEFSAALIPQYTDRSGKFKLIVSEEALGEAKEILTGVFGLGEDIGGVETSEE